MEDAKQRALSTYPSPLPFWKLYVNDVCTNLPHDHIQHLLEHQNLVKPPIQFTPELESNSKLAFRDTEIIFLPASSLTTTVFHKKTNAGQYLAFESHHPLPTRLWLHELFLLGLTTSAHPLKANRYSSPLNKRGMHSRPRKPYTMKLKATVMLPYVRHVSESI